MNFKQWLVEAIQFQGVDPEDWEVGEQAEQIMRKNNIRVDSAKELRLIATNQDQVLGAVYAGWSPGEKYEGNKVMEFSFDVAVDPAFQGFPMIGPRLIDKAMQVYEQEKEAYGKYTQIRLWVINPKLEEYLKNKYDFQGDEILYRY